MSKRTIHTEAAFCPIKKQYRLFYPHVQDFQDSAALTTSIKLTSPKNTHFSLWFGPTCIGLSTHGYVMQLNHTAFQEDYKDSEISRVIRASQSCSQPDYVDNLKKGVGFELRLLDNLGIQLLNAQGNPEDKDTGNISVQLEELVFAK